MLRVWVTNKLLDNNTGKLVGYVISDVTTGQTMRVTKDQLKAAVINKQCECMNMTLTRDGRLIGKASRLPANAANMEFASRNGMANPNIPVIDAVLTNGRGIGAVRIKDATGNLSFMSGLITKNSLASGTIVGDVQKVPRRSYSKFRNTFINNCKCSDKDFVVSKIGSSHSTDYVVKGPFDNTSSVIVENGLLSNKIKPVEYLSADTLRVQCLTGVNDVRKAVKDAFRKADVAKKKKA